MTITNKFIRDFFSYKRPHASATEMEWFDRFVKPRLGSTYTQDVMGNFHLDLRTDDTNRTLFVAHIDTVHHTAGRQTVSVGKDGMVRVVDGDCLGADDGAGVLVLLALIEMRVPAYYIFTRCEERGGLGATHLAEKQPDLLAQFDRAIAFDRKGTSSVITHQGWGRCCSDVFADALSEALSDEVLMYAPDDTGVYTDTAEFVDVIPECTNISVGYRNEHTTNETLDLVHLKALIVRVLDIDWDALPTDRDPTVYEDKWTMGKGVGRLDPWASDKYDHDYNYKDMHKYNDSEDFNMHVYDLLNDAIDGYQDELLYLMAQVGDPTDPDDLYQDIWSAKIPERELQRALRNVDYARDDDETRDVLLDLCDYIIGSKYLTEGEME